MTVVGRAEDDESALSVSGSERGVGGTICFHSAKGADVRRGDGERAALTQSR